MLEAILNRSRPAVDQSFTLRKQSLLPSVHSGAVCRAHVIDEAPGAGADAFDVKAVYCAA